MTDSELIKHLANVQDAICDIVADSITMRECRSRLESVYPDLAVAVDALINREAAKIGAAL